MEDLWYKSRYQSAAAHRQNPKSNPSRNPERKIGMTEEPQYKGHERDQDRSRNKETTWRTWGTHMNLEQGKMEESLNDSGHIYLLWHDRTLLKCEICRPTGALAWGDSRTSHLKKLPRQVSPSHSLHQLLHETVQATLLQTSNTMGDKLPHWHLGFPLLTILHGPPFNGEKNMNYADAELFWHRLRDRFFLRMSSSF